MSLSYPCGLCGTHNDQPAPDGCDACDVTEETYLAAYVEHCRQTGQDPSSADTGGRFMFLYAAPNRDVVQEMMTALCKAYGFKHSDLHQGAMFWHVRQIVDGLDKAVKEALASGA